MCTWSHLVFSTKRWIVELHPASSSQSGRAKLQSQSYQPNTVIGGEKHLQTTAHKASFNAKIRNRHTGCCNGYVSTCFCAIEISCKCCVCMCGHTIQVLAEFTGCSPLGQLNLCTHRTSSSPCCLEGLYGES